jgi:hypothetical protein
MSTCPVLVPSLRDTAATTPAPGYRAAHLIADSSVRDPVSGHAAPGDQQGLDVLRNEDPVARLKVAAGRGQDQDAIAVDELGEDADWA